MSEHTEETIKHLASPEGYAQFVEDLASPASTFSTNGQAYGLLMDELRDLNRSALVLDHIKRVITYGEKLRMNPTATILPTIPKSDAERDMLHGMLGMITEAMELAPVIIDMLKGFGVNEVNLKEELGDMQFYSQLTTNALNLSAGDVRLSNVRKLAKRYKGGTFNADEALNRDTAVELNELKK